MSENIPNGGRRQNRLASLSPALKVLPQGRLCVMLTLSSFLETQVTAEAGVALPSLSLPFPHCRFEYLFKKDILLYLAYKSKMASFKG